MLFTSLRFLLLKILLGPVMLIQGWWVRRNTPVLPEPVIHKKGQVGTGPPFRLLLVGDSSAAGVGAPCAEQSLLGELLALLRKDHQVTYHMLAETGKTTAEILMDLVDEPAEHHDLVVTALGVNDVTSQVPLNKWSEQQKALINTINSKFSPNQLIMSGLPPVREFPALPWPLNAYMGAYADQLNKMLVQITTAHEGVEFLSLRGYPDEAKAATDGFHPGPTVYRLWAQNIVAAIDIK